MNTNLTLYQLSYQEIWWVKPRIFKVYNFFVKFNHLYLHVKVQAVCVFWEREGGETPHMHGHKESSVCVDCVSVYRCWYSFFISMIMLIAHDNKLMYLILDLTRTRHVFSPDDTKTGVALIVPCNYMTLSAWSSTHCTCQEEKYIYMSVLIVKHVRVMNLYR